MRQTRRHALLLRRSMLSHAGVTMSRLEDADKSRIPADEVVSATIKRREEVATHQSSLAIPRSLQQRIRALLLHPSVAVGSPSALKNVCSPLATETSLDERTSRVSHRHSLASNQKKESVPSSSNETPFTTDHHLQHRHLPARNHSPATRSKSLVQDPPVQDLG